MSPRPAAPAPGTDALSLRLARALHPLRTPPPGPGWNAAELAGLVPGSERIPAAVLIAVMGAEAAPTVLFTRRTETLRRHPGEVSFPGGRMDSADACDLSTALREAEEEVGLAAEVLAPLGFLDPYETISAFRILPVVARVAPGVEVRPDPAEVAEAFEVPLAFLMERDNCERVALEMRGRVRHYFQFRHGRHRIWGATAAMLVNLRQRLAEVE